MTSCVRSLASCGHSSRELALTDNAVRSPGQDSASFGGSTSTVVAIPRFWN